jgi:penicillin-binding protein 2
MAVMIASLANGGTRITPHFLKALDEGDGWKPVAAPAPQSSVRLKPETTAAIREGLWMVVNAAGTARRAQIPGYDVSGKTGTAQVISLTGRRAAEGRSDRDLRDHGWFVFFAPRDNPQIAGVVFAEHGQGGGIAAAPIAKHALETFFAKREGRPLPPPPGKEPPPPAPNPPEEPPIILENETELVAFGVVEPMETVQSQTTDATAPVR